jgi:hypothetical protein
MDRHPRRRQRETPNLGRPSPLPMRDHGGLLHTFPLVPNLGAEFLE